MVWKSFYHRIKKKNSLKNDIVQRDKNLKENLQKWSDENRIGD